MKLYKVSWLDNREGTWHAEWEGTKQDAKLTRKKYTEQYKGAEDPPEIKVEAVDVPTDKGGLIAWLNARCGENG